MYPTECPNIQELTSPSQRNKVIPWHTPPIQYKVVGSGLQSSPRREECSCISGLLKDFTTKQSHYKKKSARVEAVSHATQLKEEPPPPLGGGGHVLGRYAGLWLLFIWTPTSLEQSGYKAHTFLSRCRSYSHNVGSPDFSLATISRSGIESWT